MRLKTASNHARKARRRAVYRAGFQFHMDRCWRLMISGNLDRLKNSGFIQRQRRKDKKRESN